MIDRLLICTDLDRTLIPNGPQSESPCARQYFSTLVSRPEVTLTYVSGRHRALVEQAIICYRLPVPNFVIGDVGTTIYRIGTKQEWQSLTSWETEISKVWGGNTHVDIKTLLAHISDLRAQEPSKQNSYKLSYYVPLQSDRNALSAMIHHCLRSAGVRANLIWSADEPQGVGLLDIIPAHASKYYAIEALMKLCGFDYSNTVFCGDSGNDIEVLASPIPAVLAGNSQDDVRQLSRRLSIETGHREQLYIAQGGFMGMNGNYSAGVLEGIAYYHPEIQEWLARETSGNVGGKGGE